MASRGTLVPPLLFPSAERRSVMQRIGRRIFQWFNLCLMVVVLLLLELQAISFVMYPASQQQLVMGWVSIVVFAIPLGSVAWWLVKRRWRSGGAA